GNGNAAPTGLAPGWAGARADQLSKQIMGQSPTNHTVQTDAQRANRERTQAIPGPPDTTADSRRCARSSNWLFKEPSTGIMPTCGLCRIQANSPVREGEYTESGGIIRTAGSSGFVREFWDLPPIS